MSRARRALVAAIAGLACGSISIGGETGCGSTGSKRFAFEARVGGIARDVARPYTFTNEGGWIVTLSKATVTIGPVYLNIIAPLHDQTTHRLGFPFRIKRAYANLDHLGEGRIVGEVLAQVTFDALSPAMVVFPSLGTITQEEVRTAEVWLWPSPSTPPEATKIDTVAVDLAGQAARAADRVRFRGQVILDDAWATDATAGERAATPITSLRQVRGIPLQFFPEEGGRLEIRVDLRPLLRGADFSNLQANPSDEDGTKILVQSKTGKFTTDQVMRNVFQGLRASTGTYEVRWVVP